MDKFWNWFNAERVGRVESETSQDMFQTNGSILLYWSMMIPILVAIVISIIYLG